MALKIRRKVKEGPKGYYAVPLALVIACLFGPRRDIRDFRRTIESGSEIGAVLGRYLGFEVLVADRPLSLTEFIQWDLKSRPGKLASMFWRDGLIPMGPATGDGRDEIAILPLIAVGRGSRLNELSIFIGKELPEVTQVALQNILAPTFDLIPGYDTYFCTPLVHLQDLNRALGEIGQRIRAEFEKANLPCSEEIPALPAEALDRIPVQEPFSRRLA